MGSSPIQKYNGYVVSTFLTVVTFLKFHKRRNISQKCEDCIRCDSCSNKHLSDNCSNRNRSIFICINCHKCVLNLLYIGKTPIK